MTSCEPTQCSAYGEDLRWRMIWWREALGHTNRSRKTYVLTSQLCGGPWHYSILLVSGLARDLTPPMQLFQQSFQLSIWFWDLETLLLDVDTSIVWRFLHTSGFSRQRLKITAIQQDALLRLHSFKICLFFSPEMLVFVDETGANHKRNQKVWIQFAWKANV